MIFITGDTHGNFDRFSRRIFIEQLEMTRNDYVIICGDFGGVWSDEEKNEPEKRLLDTLASRCFTILFCDGNHENFDRLYKYPEKEWMGGKVHVVRPNIYHLERGEIFELEGKSFFVFGGARSHDIQGGVLDRSDPLFKVKKDFLDKKTDLCYRIDHETWWKEEMPSEKEMSYGLNNLRKHKNKVDFIITHDCPASTLAIFGHGMYKPDELNKYLEKVRAETEYKKWFFGHYHDNRNVTYGELMIYEQLVRIS